MKTWQEILKIETSNEPLRSMTAPQLKEEQDLIVGALKTLLDTVDGEQRDVNSVEAEAFKQAEARLDGIKKEHAGRPVNQPPAIHFTSGENENRGQAFGKVGATFDELFIKSGKVQYQNDMAVEDFCNAITTKSYESRAMSGLSGEAGGFAIPTIWEKDIFNSVQSESFALARCKLYPMTSSNLHIPAWASEDQSQGHWAGVEIQRLPETGTATPRTPKMRDVELSYCQDALYVDISRPAIMDAPNLGSSLGQGMVYALQQNFDDEVLTGGGVGGPLGVVNSPGAVFVPRATAGAVGYEDIVSLRSRIHPVFAKGSVFVASTDLLKSLLLLQDGAGSYIFPSTFRGVDSEIPDSMLGRPLFFTDKLSQIGTEGDLALIDFGAVALGMRQGIFLENSTAPGWYQNLVSYRAIAMWDSKPLLQNPINPRNGSSNTLSFAAILGS